MWILIIFCILCSAYIALVFKVDADTDGFLCFKNHRLQQIVRLLFVILVIYSIVMPIVVGLPYHTMDTTGVVGLYLGAYVTFVICGIIVGFVTLGIINLII